MSAIITCLVICYFYNMFTDLFYDPSDGKFMTEKDKQKEYKKKNERIKKKKEYKKFKIKEIK